MYRSRSLIVILLGIALISLIFAGCGKDEGSSSNGEGTHELVGTWKITGTTVNGQNRPINGTSIMTFRSDNTLTATITVNGETDTGHGTWSTSGSSLTLIVEGETTTATYSVSGNICTITMTQDGVTAIVEYTKQ